MDMTPEHKLLDYAQHLGVYVVGVFTVIGAVFMWWLRGRNADRVRMVNNEKQYEQLAWMIEHKMATKDELVKCGKDKDKQHHAGIKEVIIKLDQNGNEHDNILEKMNDQHAETLKTIATLHNK